MSIRVRQSDGLTIIRLDRPEKRNALSQSMMSDLSLAFRSLSRCHAVILSGGPDVFTSGADLSEFTGTPEDLVIEQGLADTVRAIESCAVPVIAAISGVCFGAGVELTAACDVRIARLDAVFEIPATRLGILYRPDGLRRLVATLGMGMTKRLFLLNERVTGADMEACGYLSVANDPLQVAVERARRTEALEPEVVAATKRFLNDSATSDDDWEALRSRFLSR